MKNKIITIIAVITLISAPLIASAGFWDWLKPLFNQENQQLGVSRVYPFAGGTGQDSSAWTGVVQTSAGTWSASNNISIANATTSGDFYVGGFFRVGGTAGSNLNMANYRILSIGTASSTFTTAGGFIINASSTIASTLDVTATTTSGMLNVGSDKLYVGENGRVGIGTSTPSSNLSIVGGSITAGITLQELTGYTGRVVMSSDTMFVGSLHASAGLMLQTGGANRFYIDNNGNIGIKDTSPDYAFDVEATSSLANVLIVNQEPNNRVGIATTSPRYKLDVWGDMAVGTTTSATSTLLYVDTGTGGLIGMATTTPRYTLDVWGSLAIGTTTSPLLYADTGNSLITLGGDMSVGTLQIDADSGAVTLVDMSVTSAASVGTEESYSFNLDASSTPAMTIYSESDGSGGIRNMRVGIATSTPNARLHIFDQYATSTVFISSGVSGLGGQLILEDNSGDGCTSITAKDGVIYGAIVPCP